MKKIAQLFAALLLAPLFVQAAAIDAGKSSIAVTFKQEGVEVSAKFNSVSGNIDFNPNNLAASKAQITVPLASFDLGEPEYNKEVQKKEWFNSVQFPQATFVSSAIKANGAGKIIAQGKLTIKGKSLDVAVPVAVKQDGKMQVFEGQLPIKRLFFNIGEGAWKDTDTLADDVIIKFKLIAG